jgi:hypothetical protein
VHAIAVKMNAKADFDAAGWFNPAASSPFDFGLF